MIPTSRQVEAAVNRVCLSPKKIERERERELDLKWKNKEAKTPQVCPEPESQNDVRNQGESWFAHTHTPRKTLIWDPNELEGPLLEHGVKAEAGAGLWTHP